MLLNDVEGFKSPSGHQHHSPDWVHVEVAGLPPLDESEPGLLHDYVLDAQSLTWRKWTDLIDEESSKIPHDSTFKSIIVPTSDSVAITFLLNVAVENRFEFESRCTLLEPVSEVSRDD